MRAKIIHRILALVYLVIWVTSLGLAVVTGQLMIRELSVFNIVLFTVSIYACLSAIINTSIHVSILTTIYLNKRSGLGDHKGIS